MSIHKVLCPIDFSPGSDQALRVAVQVATEHDAELVILHAWYVPPLSFAGEYPLPPEVIQQMSDDAELGLAAAAREAANLGAKRVSTRIRTGLPWSTIVDTATDGIDLIVIGTHGRTGLGRVLLGSVAEKVIRHAPCSSLAVRPDTVAKPFVHALCPTDFSTSSSYAMKLATEIVRPDGGSIDLAHVLELPVSYSGDLPMPQMYRNLDALSSAELERATMELRGKTTMKVTGRSRIGHPGAEILAMIDADPTIDLVVMGSHGRTGLKRLLLGSIAEKIVRNARCPVLVAREHP
jgi:nucleotide-binding universal stress UspA family protein